MPAVAGLWRSGRVRSNLYPVLYWDRCYDSVDSQYVILETVDSLCGSGESAGKVWGYTQLVFDTSDAFLYACMNPAHSGRMGAWLYNAGNGAYTPEPVASTGQCAWVDAGNSQAYTNMVSTWGGENRDYLIQNLN